VGFDIYAFAETWCLAVVMKLLKGLESRSSCCCCSWAIQYLVRSMRTFTMVLFLQVKQIEVFTRRHLGEEARTILHGP
jgi:hypothetical protein